MAVTCHEVRGQTLGLGGFCVVLVTDCVCVCMCLHPRRLQSTPVLLQSRSPGKTCLHTHTRTHARASPTISAPSPLLQWYHQTYWQQQQQVYPPPPAESLYTYQHYSPYVSQEPPLQGNTHTLVLFRASPPSVLLSLRRRLSALAPPSYPETGRTPHQPVSYPEGSRAAEGQTDGQSNGEWSLFCIWYLTAVLYAGL